MERGDKLWAGKQERRDPSQLLPHPRGVPVARDRNVILVLAMVYINMVLGPNDGVFTWVISPNGGGLNVTHD